MCRTCLNRRTQTPVTHTPTPTTLTATPQTPPPATRGHFLQWNANGIQNSQEQLLQFLDDRKILVACVQETKLSDRSPPPTFKNYSVIRKDRPGGRGGGLITLVHHSVKYQEAHLPFPGDNTIEHQAVTVDVDGAHLLVCNIYVPPVSSCPQGYIPNFAPLFSHTGDILVMGDFNAHDDTWYSSTQDEGAANRGANIVDALDNSQLMTINLDSPTRKPSNGPCSSPDLTITNSHLGLHSSWVPETTLNSDHLPIIIDLDGWFTDLPSPGPSCYTNYRKANWTTYTEETEVAFSNLPPPTSCASGEKTFRNILLTASRRNVPRGKIPNFTPGLTDHARRMMSERDRARQEDPSDPRIAELEAEISRETDLNKRNIWRSKVESCSVSKCSGKYFKLLRDLSGTRKRHDPNQPITFEGRVLTDDRGIASSFARMFTKPVQHIPNRSTRRTLRRIRREHRLDPHVAPFTSTQVRAAINSSKNSTAPSADGLTIHELKHLGPLGIAYLTSLYNLSFQQATLPAIWKHAIILPLLKPGKLKDQGSSYRPISILCPASKILEKLILQYISPHLVLADSQHGFRPGRSTTTALLPLVQQAATGFNQPRPPGRTVVMAVDFSKAFDTVDHIALLNCLLNSTIDSNSIRWVCSYLRGRTASCSYNRKESAGVHVRQGVPQGSVLSPALFNFYVASYPQSAEQITSYADDFTAFATDPQYERAAAHLTRHAEDVCSWAQEKSLVISAQKSTVTLLTSQTQQVRDCPAVTMNGVPLPVDPNPKILGVTFDPTMRFQKHVEGIIRKAKPQLNLLRLLTGSSWGQHKETLLATFKSLIGSLITYAAPVWFPNTSATSRNKLQIIQNSALRIATGCVKMSGIDDLHAEARMLKVEDHLSMLCSQFLATCLQPGHPSLPIVTADSGPREMKKTLQRCFGETREYGGGQQRRPTSFQAPLTDQLVNGLVPDIKKARQSIHTRAVEEAIEARKPNRVLGAAAPDVGVAAERDMSRRQRTTLAQLRTGFCSALNGYLHTIGAAESPLCPCCRQAEHTVQHLFQCINHPTTHTAIDLWYHPDLALRFLRTWPCLEERLQRERPPPEPPPPT